MADLETLLLAALTAEPDAPTPRQVTEAAALLGVLSDPDSRWFKPAVAL